MLPKFTEFIVVNNSGRTVTFNANGRLNLKITGWYLNPTTGKEVLEELSDDNFGFVAGDSVLDGGEEVTSEIDNSSNLYLGYLVQLEVTHDEGALADGTFDLYISQGDATGELVTDASGYDSAESSGLTPFGPLTWQPSALDDEVLRSEMFEV